MALIWNSHQGDLKWERNANFAVHRVLGLHPRRVIHMVATSIRASMRNTAYFVTRPVTAPHPCRGIPMDATNMAVTVSTASTVDRQARGQHRCQATQINVTKDRGVDHPPTKMANSTVQPSSRLRQ